MPATSKTATPSTPTLTLDVGRAGQWLAANLQQMVDAAGHSLRALSAYEGEEQFRVPPPRGILFGLSDSLPPRVPGTAPFMQSSGALTPEQSLHSARRWITTSAFRDIIRLVGAFLEVVRADVELVRVAGPDGGLSPAALRQVLAGREALLQQFTRWGLPRKIQVLREDCGLAFSAELEQLINCLLSINKARNCLEHRLGDVAANDANDPQSRVLRVDWIAVEMLAVLPDGTTVPAEVDMYMEALRVNRRAPRHREFDVGSELEFSNQDFVDMAWTVNEMAAELVGVVGLALARAA